MGINPETKVGILTAFTLLALFSLFFWLNRVTFLQKGSEAEVVFDRIEGLRPGAPVKYIGVDVGRINKIYFENRRIIVLVHISQGFKLPVTSKGIIASSGVIGDKYLELQPLKPGERPLPGGRIQGEAPVSMEQLYAGAYEVIQSVKQTVDSLNQIVADPANANSIKNSLANLEKLTVAAERLIAGNESAVNDLVRNAGQASAQLAQAGAAANRFLGKLADPKTTGDIKQLLSHINALAANLEQFSTVLAAKGPQLGALTDDAHQTLNAITQAAQSLSTAVDAFNNGDGAAGGQQNNLTQIGSMVRKAGSYVKNFARLSASQQIGVGYQASDDSDNFAVNYRANLNLDERQGITFEIADIGYDNLGTLQYNLRNRNYATRLGLYRNQVGIGMDWTPHPHYSVGVDLWDTHSANLGLTTNWRMTPEWMMSLSAARELETDKHNWNVGWWRKF
jgi:phospholipid/cholesterol/gamma-HCH transport system substrate-binding protein